MSSNLNRIKFKLFYKYFTDFTIQKGFGTENGIFESDTYQNNATI